MADKFNVLVICGSLRKGSFNASVARALPGLAPPELELTPAPSFGNFPIYNVDDQTASGIPADVRPGAMPSARPTASSSSRRNTTGRSPAA